MNIVQFQQIVEAKLPAQEADRIMRLGVDYGETLLFDVVNVILHARDGNKLEPVLGLLEDHYKRRLQFQHPDIRGRVGSAVGGNPTERMFAEILHGVLGLKGKDIEPEKGQ